MRGFMGSVTVCSAIFISPLPVRQKFPPHTVTPSMRSAETQRRRLLGWHRRDLRFRVSRLLQWQAITAIIIVAGGALFAGCYRQPELPPAACDTHEGDWFFDATAEAGLDFTHDPGPTGTYFFPQI